MSDEVSDTSRPSAPMVVCEARTLSHRGPHAANCECIRPAPSTGPASAPRVGLFSEWRSDAPLPQIGPTLAESLSFDAQVAAFRRANPPDPAPAPAAPPSPQGGEALKQAIRDREQEALNAHAENDELRAALSAKDAEIARLMEERDEARGALASRQNAALLRGRAAHEASTEAAALRSRVEVLEGMVQKYGSHWPTCAPGDSCSCGYDAETRAYDNSLRAALSEGPKAEDPEPWPKGEPRGHVP